jgi:hypothetical protein
MFCILVDLMHGPTLVRDDSLVMRIHGCMNPSASNKSLPDVESSAIDAHGGYMALI